MARRQLDAYESLKLRAEEGLEIHILQGIGADPLKPCAEHSRKLCARCGRVQGEQGEALEDFKAVGLKGRGGVCQERIWGMAFQERGQNVHRLRSMKVECSGSCKELGAAKESVRRLEQER